MIEVSEVVSLHPAASDGVCRGNRWLLGASFQAPYSTRGNISAATPLAL